MVAAFSCSPLEGDGKGQVVAHGEVVGVFLQAVDIPLLRFSVIAGEVERDAKTVERAGVAGLQADDGIELLRRLVGSVQRDQDLAVTEPGPLIVGSKGDGGAVGFRGAVVVSHGGRGLGVRNQRRRALRLQHMRAMVQRGGGGQVAAGARGFSAMRMICATRLW